MKIFDIIYRVYVALWDVTLDMAPYLLFGFLLAGLLSVLLPTAWVKRHLSGRGFKQVVKASLIGVPLPLCSCGVIPVTAALRERGAGKGATVSFLASTPQTGVDSILATAALLGWTFALYRTLLAFVSGILAGAVSLLVPETKSAKTSESDVKADPLKSSCCGGEKIESEPAAAGGCCCSAKDTAPPVASSCCADEIEEATVANGQTPPGALSRMTRFALVTLPKDLALPLLIGLIISALISVLVPDDFFQTAWGGALQGGIPAMLLMIVVAIPMYVCATASIPLAWALIDKGGSPGMALVFLMTGPATNAATIAVLWKMLGRRTTLVYLGSIIITGVIGGVLLDYLYASTDTAPLALSHAMLPHGLRVASAIILFLLIVSGLVARHREKKNKRQIDVPSCCGS
jgi:uncharacterized protein